MKQGIKQCAICKVDFPTMYRIQYKQFPISFYTSRATLKTKKPVNHCL